jgi:hypothetical protein
MTKTQLWVRGYGKEDELEWEWILGDLYLMNAQTADCTELPIDVAEALVGFHLDAELTWFIEIDAVRSSTR